MDSTRLIQVDGTAGEYIEFLCQGATTGTGRINFTLAGRYKTAALIS